ARPAWAGRRRASSSWALLALGRPRAAVLFPEALALLRRQLAEALARLGALLRGHVSPALIVLHDALPLAGRHRLPLAVALEDVLAPLRGELLDALVRPLQLLPPPLRQLVPALEVSDDPRLLVGRERPVALEAFLRSLPLLGRHGLPVTVVLEHACALLRREALPPLEIAFGDRAL